MSANQLNMENVTIRTPPHVLSATQLRIENVSIYYHIVMLQLLKENVLKSI